MGKEQIAGWDSIADIRVGRVMHASEIFHRETSFHVWLVVGGDVKRPPNILQV